MAKTDEAGRGNKRLGRGLATLLGDVNSEPNISSSERHRDLRKISN